MAKKRMLIISDYYLPHWTGIVKTVSYMTDVAREWLDITVLTTRHSANLSEKQTIKTVRIIRSSVLFSLSRAKVSLSMLVRIVFQIPKSEIVFINSPSLYMAFGSLVAKVFGKKLFIFHQGDLRLPSNFFNRIIEKVFDLSSFFACMLADKVFCATEDYAKNSRILRHFMKKFHIMPILAPHPEAKSTTTQNPVLRLLKELRKNGYIIVGFAGRFVEEKGFDILLKAMPSVIKKNKKIHFVFAGDLHVTYESFFQKNRDALESLKNNLSQAGLLDAKDLDYFYNSIDCIVLPSRSDCFPTVQIEAMLHKKPAIVTDIPGARIPVAKTNFGILVKPEDPISLANAIVEMSDHLEHYQQNYKNVLNYFNFSNDAQIVKTNLTN